MICKKRICAIPMTQEWRIIMKLKDTGLTAQDIKDKVNKYMIETYERFDFLAETAKICIFMMRIRHHILTLRRYCS